MLRQASSATTAPKMRILFLLGLVMLHVTSSNAMAVTRFRKAVDEDDRLRSNSSGNGGGFPAKLFKEIAKTATEDFVYSPISAIMILSMTAFGAKSSTRDQVRSALGIPNENVFTEYLSTIRPVLESLTIYERVDLRLAHKMFLSNRFQLKGDFVSAMRDTFLSEAETVDFGNAEAARTTINEWCSGQTNERFNDLIKPADINRKTSIILVNVAYFRGSWARPFSPEEIIPREFWIHGTTPVYPLTMRQFGSYRHGELPEVDAQFIELPYVSDSDLDAVSMFVILPNERNGIDKVKNNFEKVDVSDRRNGIVGPVDLYLPKFKIESSIDLAQPLNQMAVSEMFARTADFRGISDSRQLKVSKIVQRNAIEVDEQGTEGVASNIVFESDDITTTTTAKPAVEFRVDHPFVILIETRLGLQLFAAVVSSGEGFEYRTRSTCCDDPAP